MNDIEEKYKNCLFAMRQQTDFVPKLAVVLGSGLGGFADMMDDSFVVKYSSLPGHPVSTVPGHRGRYVFGRVNGVPVAAMQGRVHYYEGYPVSDIVLPIRLLAGMGTQAILLTNAAGGINPAFEPGDFMLMRDHILLFYPNPLIGPNVSALGTRFPDMSQVYDPELSELICTAGRENHISLRQGVYCQITGPSFETPAEIRMLHALGADAVGMSTACEAVTARHAGMRVCGISCISNKAAGMAKNPLTHEEVKETADRVAPLFRTLVWDSIVRICAALDKGEDE